MDKLEIFIQVAQTLHNEGAKAEQIIHDLAEQGASLIQTILILKSLGYKTASAQALVLNSETWSPVKETVLRLTEQFINGTSVDE